MRSISVFSGIIPLVFVGMAYAQSGPVINPGGVISSASFAPVGGSNAGLAEGSFISIFGTNLGPSTAVQAAALPLGATLGQSSVTITPASGSAVQAYMVYVSAGQINAILPSNTPVGVASVTVTYNGATSAPIKVNVVKSSFGIFTAASGAGPAATINLNTAPVYYNLFTNAAHPGDTLELYGTGLGPISGSDASAPGAVSPTGVTVQVLVGTQLITPSYAGRAPQYPALDQINFQLPSDNSIADSCFVPIAVVVNGVTSNFGTISKISSGTTCPAPFGLSAAKLQALQAGGTINAGFLNLSSINTEVSSSGVTLDSSIQSAGGIFSSESAAGLLGLTQTLGGVPPLNPPGSCVVETINAQSAPTSATPPVTSELDAGASLSLSGSGKTASIPYKSTGYSATVAQSALGGTPLNGLPASFITPGSWTITGPGGKDIGPFNATINIPTPLTCTNCSSITSIDRTKPLTVTWTGGGGSQDYVQVGGLSTAASVADPTKNVATVFLCAARASDQTFTVPANILGQMFPASSNPLSSNFGTLILINQLGSGNSFTAPLTAGGNLDLAFFNYSSVFLRVVGFN